MIQVGEPINTCTIQLTVYRVAFLNGSYTLESCLSPFIMTLRVCHPFAE